MQKLAPIESGNYYHVFNCGINGEKIFVKEANYYHFLKLYDKYISSIAETYTWCLMSNHFHLLVKITDLTGFKNPSGQLEQPTKPIHQYFSNLFNAYSKAYNKKYHRHGSLFERPFKRKLITSESYLKQTVIYIHNNPIHHDYCHHPYEYPWSSYQTCISKVKTKLKRKAVLEWFTDVENFKQVHNKNADVTKIENWLKEEQIK